MLKPLRHPTVFVLMTCCLAGWLASLSLFNEPTSGKAVRHRFVPVERALDLITGRDRSTFSQTRVLSVTPWPHQISTAGINPASFTLVDEAEPPIESVLVYETESGVRAVLAGDDADILPLPPDQAAGFVVGSYHNPDTFGLVTPCVNMRSISYRVVRSPLGSAPLNEEAALRAAKKAGLTPSLSQWDIQWTYVAHDTLFAFALLAWLYALLTIPTWKLWRNITPAQRRRNRHACPSCRYDRSAAPDAPCPECGAALSIK